MPSIFSKNYVPLASNFDDTPEQRMYREAAADRARYGKASKDEADFNSLMAGGDEDFYYDYDGNLVQNEGGGITSSVYSPAQASERQRQALLAKRGIERADGDMLMDRTNQLLNNPATHFGKGGGDWANAWLAAQQRSPGVFGALAGNQLQGFLNYDNQLNQAYNSPTGPYGQLQAAAVATAPERTERQRIGMQRDLLGQLMNRIGGADSTPKISSVETDYGAYAKMNPSSFKKYLPPRRG